MAGFLMNYLSLYACVNGRNAKVPFPGSPKSWEILSTDGGQDLFARFSIHLTLHPEKAGNSEAYNIEGTIEGYRFADRWPFICEYFGPIGEPPADPSASSTTPSQFIREHQVELKDLETKLGGDCHI